MDYKAEWLEADGRGGFASGTVSLARTRRYHAILLTAATPPTGRVVLVNGFDAWVETPSGSYALTTQHYAPGVDHPDGWRRIESFTIDPWPRWVYQLDDDTRVEQELIVPRGQSTAVVRWRASNPAVAMRLTVRPFFSGRDYHTLQRESDAINLMPQETSGVLVWQTCPDLPRIAVRTSGTYRHEPFWYRNFLYEEERTRGLDDLEDLASPGAFSFVLNGEWSVAVFDGLMNGEPPSTAAALVEAERLVGRERVRRRKFPTSLHRAADAYVVERDAGKTIIAGYPWFTDWGRDTFIALRGLCLATGRVEEAEQILLDWSGHVSQGMLPNRFPDDGGAPEYNSVDASLWFAVAVDETLRARSASGETVLSNVRQRLYDAVAEILTGYARGTRHGIRLDKDGLLACGEPGVQLTWMDAKAGDWVVTPRIGKPVEVQCLWLSALEFASQFDRRWREALELGRKSFAEKFWNATEGCLFDVIDVDHVAGKRDPAIRPNQIFAIGGLPSMFVDEDRARMIVEVVQHHLLTPLGLRTLAPAEPDYAPRYEGDILCRDGAYHQGTVWPWLMGPFVEAWVRVHGNTHSAKRQARERFLPPLLAHLNEAGLGHISEIADADPPHTPRGCPFQAWSLGELLRLERLLGEREAAVANDRRGC